MSSVKVFSIVVEFSCPYCNRIIHIKTHTSDSDGLLEGSRSHECEFCFKDVFWCLVIDKTVRDDMPPKLVPIKSF